MQYSMAQPCPTASEQLMPLQLPQLPAPPALCREGSSLLSSAAKGQLLDTVGIQSSIHLFNAKYPNSNAVCGMQVGDAPELQWQCFGADAGQPEVQRVLKDFVNEELRYQRGLKLDHEALASSGLPRSGARYRSLRAFVDAAAMAGIVAGVQVSMLLDLASKMCSAGPQTAPTSEPAAAPSAAATATHNRTTSSSYQGDRDVTAAGASADRDNCLMPSNLPAAAGAASMPPPLLQPLQPLASHATATTSSTLLRLLQQSLAQQPSCALNHTPAPDGIAIDPQPSSSAAAAYNTAYNASNADAAAAYNASNVNVGNSNGDVGTSNGYGAPRGGRKPRFTREQHAAIMESVERNYAQHPSRYTDLVIREMKERFPGLELASASVRKLKFRANEANKGDCNADTSGRDSAAAREAAAAAAAREAVKSLVGLRNCGQQQQQQQQEQQQQKQEGQQFVHGQEGQVAAEHAAAMQYQPDQPVASPSARLQAPGPATGLLQCLEAAEQLDAAAAATATATAAAAPTAAATAACPSPSVGAKRGRSEPEEAAAAASSGAGRGAGAAGASAGKRQRMTAEQMASLVDCVKRHVESCPERYSQLVIADMKAAYPDLELNMGQIRKIKFRTLGNARKAGDDLDAHLNSSDTEDEARPARQGNNYGLHGSSMGSYGGSFGGDERGGGGAFGCR